MSGTGPRIAIASDLSLVAETVRTALASRGYECFVVRWPDGRQCEADAGLIICDLVPTAQLCSVQRLVRSSGFPWLLLTGAPPGPLWGGALETGVAGVLPSAATLDRVELALGELLAGTELHDPDERQGWVREWAELRARKAELAGQVESLTPRERTVLRLLYAGEGVRDIAATLEVSEATVRSHVKAVLRKFRVSSQLDAVAVLGSLRDDPEPLEC